MAQIMNVTIDVGLKPAPVIAPFSSRGPNPLEKSILKVCFPILLITPCFFKAFKYNSVIPCHLQPDITAPGVNILASYPTGRAPTASLYDQRRIPFNILAGTSMACPHISGIVALLKFIHPDWSPAAIKSALMTTGKVAFPSLITFEMSPPVISID